MFHSYWSEVRRVDVEGFEKRNQEIDGRKSHQVYERLLHYNTSWLSLILVALSIRISS